MPHFIIIGRDRPGSASLRADTRPRHLDHIRSLGAALLVGGPTLDESGAATGSVVIADFPDLAAARDFAERDPYRGVDLFESVTVQAWRKVLPE